MFIYLENRELGTAKEEFLFFVVRLKVWVAILFPCCLLPFKSDCLKIGV
jgi:hypothetical protein